MDPRGEETTETIDEQKHETTSKMGLDGEIQQLLEDPHFKPTGCIAHGIPHFESSSTKAADSMDESEADDDEDVPEQDSIVIVLSVMCYMNGTFPALPYQPVSKQSTTELKQQDPAVKYGLNAFSLDEIYRRVVGSITRAFARSKRLHAYVLTADKLKWVPKEKQATQDKRPSDPYPPTAIIDERGVYIDGTWYGIQVARIMQTRWMREAFFSLLQRKLVADPALHRMRIICDWTHEAPVQLFQGKQTELPKTQIGEDDLLMSYWGSFFGKRNLLFHSRDRDMIPILLLHEGRFRRQAICQFDDERYIDIKRMAKKLVQAGWTVPLFVQACILCGCDYFDKKDVLYLQSTKTILASMLWIASNRIFAELTASIQNFRTWLLLVYSHRLGQKTLAKSGETIQRICAERDKKLDKKRKTKRVKAGISWPTDANIAWAFSRLSFTFHYWNSMHFRLYHLKDD